ncbi:MAG: polysaccharide pyruvyl transferase family protein [Flavobacteriaceae bacterium]|nr:polysaccharide pyruvyl transferase family protein [Flavobacteriaceae bacterium]
MKKIKTLHLASFEGNIGDNANHNGFYKKLHQNKNFNFEIDKLEIREFYWKKRFFDKNFVDLVNSYDLLIIGGGNYFELWVEDSPTGTSIALDLELLKLINIPILCNALGVDPGQGASDKNINKFKNFLRSLNDRNDFISIRNDGARKTIIDYLGEEWMDIINHTPDAGFFLEVNEVPQYYLDKKYMAVNIVCDMPETRFKNMDYDKFVSTFKDFFNEFLSKYKDYEIVFIPHIFRDVKFINDILTVLNDDDRRKRVSVAPLLHGEKSFAYVMSIYKGAEFALSNRFHANVCSIGLGTPTIGIVNYRQVRELYNEIESDSFVDVRKEGFNIELLKKVENLDKTTSNEEVMGKIRDQYQRYMIAVSSWLNERF